VYGRLAAAQALQEEDRRRAVSALRLVADRQVAAVRYYRTSAPVGGEDIELHATASWNLLVSLAQLWKNHPEFPADAAVETFDCDAEHPLTPGA
jgi:hypothetical protein